MTETRRRGLARVGAVAVLTVGVVFVFMLANLALATRQARRAEAEFDAENRREATQVAAVQTATYHAASDEYAAEWARAHKKWALPGDHVVVPVAPTAAASPTPTPAAAEGGSPLDRMWRWLHGR